MEREEIIKEAGTEGEKVDRKNF